jgi:hypothetical protein
MNANQKVNMTFEALDLELEILSKAQQQVIMGGSNSSNGEAAEDPVMKALLDKMVGDGPTASSGTFEFDSSAATQKDNLRKSLKAMYEKSPTGKKFLNALSKAYEGKSAKVKVAIDSDLPYGQGRFLNGTNTMSLSSIGRDDDAMKSLSHELMHAYEDAKGGLGGSVTSEADAYILQAKIAKEAGWGNQVFGLPNTATPNNAYDYSDAGQKYQDAMQGLISEGFTLANYNKLIANFKTGSLDGSQTIYADYTQTGVIEVDSDTDLIGLVSEFLGRPIAP